MSTPEAAAAAKAAAVILGVRGGVGGCELLLLGVVLPSNAADNMFEAGNPGGGDPADL